MGEACDSERNVGAGHRLEGTGRHCSSAGIPSTRNRISLLTHASPEERNASRTRRRQTAKDGGRREVENAPDATVERFVEVGRSFIARPRTKQHSSSPQEKSICRSPLLLHTACNLPKKRLQVKNKNTNGMPFCVCPYRLIHNDQRWKQKVTAQ